MPTFLDIENPTAPQHPMFREDESTGLPMKLTRQEKTTSQAHQNSPTKKRPNPQENEQRGVRYTIYRQHAA